MTNVNKTLPAFILLLFMSLLTARADTVLYSSVAGTNLPGNTNNPAYVSLPSSIKLGDLGLGESLKLSFDVRFSTLDNQTINSLYSGLSFGFLSSSASVAYGWVKVNSNNSSFEFLKRSDANMANYNAGSGARLSGVESYGTQAIDAIRTNTLYHYEFSVVHDTATTYSLLFNAWLEDNLLASYTVTDISSLLSASDITRLGFRQYDALGLTGGTGITNIVVSQISAIPEPSAAFLLGIGLGTLVLLRRHGGKKHC
ncbi:MAG: PEP-CTERM sorting domain-containing protein [Verrucomicrobiales bacterium]|jgi:hypothetical protein|nr:PEP-CTERM sorting domain-containing protein [Verrucomicrobiales bacterium]